MWTSKIQQPVLRTTIHTTFDRHRQMVDDYQLSTWTNRTSIHTNFDGNRQILNNYQAFNRQGQIEDTCPYNL